jgi:pimeloyl-ACP methyl ester carboxylesterase
MPWLAVWPKQPVALPDGTPSTPTTDSTSPDDDAAAAERFFRRMVGDAAWDRLPDAGRAARRADGPALAAELRAIRVSEAPFDVGALAVPAIFGRGERSAPRHRQSVAWLVEHTPGAELVEFPGATHGAHLTHPDAFAAMARRALALAGRPASTTA